MNGHGIFREESTLRVHLSALTGFIFSYPTEDARKMAETGRWSPFEKTVNDLGEEATGAGFAVPIQFIPHLRASRWQRLMADHARVKAMSTSEKGAYAVDRIVEAIERGMMPRLGTRIERVVTDKATQIRGIDIITDLHWLEVKYDEPAGPERHGGSGNLFIQYAERNPTRSH